jgi:hypothetical protein
MNPSPSLSPVLSNPVQLNLLPAEPNLIQQGQRLLHQGQSLFQQGQSLCEQARSLCDQGRSLAQFGLSQDNPKPSPRQVKNLASLALSKWGAGRINHPNQGELFPNPLDLPKQAPPLSLFRE